MNKADYPNPSPKGKKSSDSSPLPPSLSNAGKSSNASSQGNSQSNSQNPGGKESDLFVLAQKLRQRNRTLQEQVAQLQESLQIAEEKLHRQSQQFTQQESIRSQEVGTILSQQTAEASYANEQVGRLLQELEGFQQLGQRQQILIETLSTELQTSQERIAQLERECALTQQQYNDQCHQLLQSEGRCQELHTRLQRQQRQTLQFKMALEKSLEVPLANQTPEIAEELELALPRKVSLSTLNMRVNAKPIEPWSNPAEAIAQGENPALVLGEQKNTEESRAEISPALVAPEALPAPKPHLSPLEEMMQPLILSLNAPIDRPRLEPAPERLGEARPEIFSEKFPEKFPEPRLDTLFDVSEISRDRSPTPRNTSPDLRQYLLSLQSPPPEPEVLDISTNDQKLQQLLAVVKRSPYIPPETNDLAPVIYPERPPKKIPSLSAINLPNFPRHRSPEN